MTLAACAAEHFEEVREMSGIKLKDFLEYRFLSRLQLSPDGAKAAFVVSRQDEKTNDYLADIYLAALPGRSITQLTHTGKEHDFVWDGNDALLFAARRCEADEPQRFYQKTCFYRLPLSGGEAQRAFEVPYDVKAIRPCGDGVHYAMAVRIDHAKPDPRTHSEEECEDAEDYILLEEMPFATNGEGYTSRVRMALALYDATDGSTRLLTEPMCMLGAFEWAGREIVYTGHTYTTVRQKTKGLYAYDIATQKTRTLVEDGKLAMYHIGVLNAQVMFTASDLARYGSASGQDFYTVPLAGGTAQKLLDYELVPGTSPITDSTYGGGRVFVCAQNGVHYTVLQRFHTHLCTRDASGALRADFEFNGGIQMFDTCAGTTVFVGMAANGLQELYLLENGRAVCISRFNSPLLARRTVQPAHYEPFENRAGQQIDGWVLQPVGYVPGQKYPGILEIHGGPKAAYGEVFFHEMQVLAAQGYFVFFCNPRGSDARGAEFADVRGKYGGIDYEDLMDFTDHVLARYPDIDPARLGVTGGSYGGIMTNWIIGHTHRFAAAVSCRSVANFVSDFGQSEISYNDDLAPDSAPWQAPELLWKESPIAYLKDCVTPTLFMHSTDDHTCCVEQTKEIFTALTLLGVPTRACLFKGENHELSRSGKPRHRVRRLKELVQWMAEWLQGDASSAPAGKAGA